jgi:hypothetical protein
VGQQQAWFAGKRNSSTHRRAPSSAPLQKFYETKQYKKGLKAADAVLKKFPNHGGE